MKTIEIIRENEVLSLVLGAGVLHFVLLKYSELKRNPSIGILVPAYLLLFSAWSLSILEAFFWEEWLNLIEHVLYLLSALCLLLWILRLPPGPKGTIR